MISQTLFSEFISQFIVTYVGLQRGKNGVDQFDSREDRILVQITIRNNNLPYTTTRKQELENNSRRKDMT